MSATMQLEMPVVEQTAPAMIIASPTKRQVVEKICEECDTNGVYCDRSTADYTFELFGLIATRAYALQHAEKLQQEFKIIHQFSDDEMELLHSVIEVILRPHDTSPRPGTAHAYLNAIHLSGGFQVFEHTIDEDDPDKSCAVAIRVVDVDAIAA
jgi:hypothetical protein